MEFMAVSASPYDTDRFGAALPRFSPRQADLLMVVGTVTHKQAPVLLKVYEQMCEPKWVMAFRRLRDKRRLLSELRDVAGIDRVIAVDVYIPGCPPRPEMVIDGIMQLQDKIARAKHTILTKDLLSDGRDRLESLQQQIVLPPGAATLSHELPGVPARARRAGADGAAPEGGIRLRPLPRRDRGRLAGGCAALRGRSSLRLDAAAAAGSPQDARG
jgi:NADH-quinone oxidoreductase subunit B